MFDILVNWSCSVVCFLNLFFRILDLPVTKGANLQLHLWKTLTPSYQCFIAITSFTLKTGLHLGQTYFEPWQILKGSHALSRIPVIMLPLLHLSGRTLKATKTIHEPCHRKSFALATAIWIQSRESISSYKWFTEPFQQVFEYTPEEMETGKLLKVTHGKGNTAKHPLKFHMLVASRGWKVPALKAAKVFPKTLSLAPFCSSSIFLLYVTFLESFYVHSHCYTDNTQLHLYSVCTMLCLIS